MRRVAGWLVLAATFAAIAAWLARREPYAHATLLTPEHRRALGVTYEWNGNWSTT